MTTPEPAMARLYSRFEEVLGPGHAETMASHFATKADIDRLDRRFENVERRLDRVEAGIQRMDERIDARLAKMEERFDAGLVRIDARMSETNARTDAQVTTLTQSLDSGIRSTHEMVAKQWRYYTTIMITSIFAILAMLRWVG